MTTTRKPTRRTAGKPAASQAAATATAPPAAPADPNAVWVRMYGNILGDCFLLRFPGRDRTVYVMIDCGILQGMPEAKATASAIVQDVLATTGGRLDVLAVTHEHWDHLSGFQQAEDLFDRFEEIGELWLGWTENERDEQARRLRGSRTDAMTALARSFTILERRAGEAADEADADEAEAAPGREFAAFGGLAGFLGWDGEAPSLTKSETILAKLKAKAKSIRYWEPGRGPVPLPGCDGAAVYVLGPPRSEAALRRSAPTRSGREVYELRGDDGEADWFVAATAAIDRSAPLDADTLERLKMTLPFDLKLLNIIGNDSPLAGLRRNATDPEDQAFFDKLYEDPENAWRRIDEDWLGTAETLALKLDSDTNNTSLVLAFEVGKPGEGRILLFPGDAQVGNWESWFTLEWPAPQAGQPPLTAKDLLERTVLYKVGHHGSHNATLRDKGLELMTSRDLVAMIPVVEEFAVNKKRWKMPFASLLARLEEKTCGRVIRGDRTKAELAQGIGAAGRLTAEDREAFLAAVRDGDASGADRRPLYVEYQLSRSA